jgi:PadR family transcriptional regulator PadR
MAARESNPNFMNGVPELLILRLLQHEEMYGYEIVQAIQSRTASVISVGEGVVYPVLHGLEQDGALTSRRKAVNGRSRIYYSVTPAGSRRLADLTQTWTSLTAAVHRMLQRNRDRSAQGHISRELISLRNQHPACSLSVHVSRGFALMGGQYAPSIQPAS